jgi:hypothetical protein
MEAKAFALAAKGSRKSSKSDTPLTTQDSSLGFV